MRVGDILGGFQVEGLLGEGGAGAVYRARQLSLDRAVALKVLRGELSADPTMRARFLKEGQLAARLTHPHLVDILTAGEEGGELYLAYELIASPTLRAVLASRGRLPIGDVVALGKSGAEVLSYIHEAGIVHRDLKPENLFADPERGLLMADLGIAKDSSPGRTLTARGVLLGTPAYMAPEVVSGAPAGPPADLYALGVVLYECLTGAPPFRAGDPVQLLRLHLTASPRALRDHRDDVPPSLEQAVLGLLEKDPARRQDGSDRLAGLFARGESAASSGAAGAGETTVNLHLPGPAPRTRESRASIGPAPTAVRGQDLLQPTRTGLDTRPAWGLRAALIALVVLIGAGGLAVGIRMEETPSTGAPGIEGSQTEGRSEKPPSPLGGSEPASTLDPLKTPSRPLFEALGSLPSRLRSALRNPGGSFRKLSNDQVLQRTAGEVARTVRDVRRELLRLRELEGRSETARLLAGRLLFETYRVLRHAREEAHAFGGSDTLGGLVLRQKYDNEVADEMGRLVDELPPDALDRRTDLYWCIGVIGVKSIAGIPGTQEQVDRERVRLHACARWASERLSRGSQAHDFAFACLFLMFEGLEDLGLGEQGARLVNQSIIPATRNRPPSWLPEQLAAEAMDALLAEHEALRSPEAVQGSPERLEQALVAWTTFEDRLLEAQAARMGPAKPFAGLNWQEKRQEASAARAAEILPRVRQRLAELARLKERPRPAE